MPIINVALNSALGAVANLWMFVGVHAFVSRFGITTFDIFWYMEVKYVKKKGNRTHGI